MSGAFQLLDRRDQHSRAARLALAVGASLLLAVTGAAAQEIPAEVRRVELESDAGAATVILHTDATLSWSVDERATEIIVRLPESAPGPGAVDQVAPAGLVARVDVGFAVPDGVPTSRFTIRLREPSAVLVEGRARTVVVHLSRDPGAPPILPTAPPGAPEASGVEMPAQRSEVKLRRELEAARADWQTANDEAAALEARVRQLEQRPPRPRTTVSPSARPCLLLRAGPGTEHRRLDCLVPGTSLLVLNDAPGWLSVRPEGRQPGWVATRFVEEFPGASGETFERAASDRFSIKAGMLSCLNLRPTPELGSPTLDCLAPGTVVTRLSESGNWMRLRLEDGREGWSSSRFLDPVPVDVDSGPDSALADARAELDQVAERERTLASRVRGLEAALAPADTGGPASSRASEPIAELRSRLDERERTIADLRARLAASEAASNRPVASPGDGGGESSPNEVETKPRRATRAERRTDERKERIGALERDLKAARRALEAGESDKAKLAADLRELERENLALSRDTSALRTARRELDAALEDRAQLTRRLARAESSLEQERAASRERAESRPGRRDQRLREAMKGLEGELGDARRALERSESERSRLAADLEDLEQRNRRLSDDTTALSAARADLATAERDRDQLARQLERVESDLERERSAARTRNARSEKRANPKKSELRRTIEELENENARLARERDDLDLRNRELAADAAALDLAQRDLAAARAYGNELVKRLADLELETLRREPPAAQVAVDAERALPIEPLVAEMPDPVARTDPSEIEAVARSWAAAWSSQSVADYLAFYSDAFVPANGMDLTAWRAQRRQRLSRPEFIRVEIRDLETRIDGPERATIVFRQSYQSDTYSDDVEKTLELARLDGSWKILSERAR